MRDTESWHEPGRCGIALAALLNFCWSARAQSGFAAYPASAHLQPKDGRRSLFSQAARQNCSKAGHVLHFCRARSLNNPSPGGLDSHIRPPCFA
jgi:hypothetical protein